MPKVGIYILLT